MIPTINKRETGINIRKIMDERNLNVKDVQTYLGLASVQSIYHWLNGLTMPTIDNLYALSELFQLPIDALISGNRKPIVKDVETLESYNIGCKRIYTYYVKLNKGLVA